jgi:hypothetical protein
MMVMKRIFLALFVLAFGVDLALAQAPTVLCTRNPVGNCIDVGPSNPLITAPAAPSGSVSGGAGSTAAASAVLKASSGSLLSLTVVDGATAGWVMLFDATSAPAGGATGASLKYCFPVQASSGVAISWPVPLVFAVGITAAFSSTTCSTYTPSATAFFYGQVQ